MVRTRSQTLDGRDSEVHGRRQNASDSDNVSDGENAQHQRYFAKAVVNYKATNMAELSFLAGDEIGDVEQIGPNLWAGTNRRTGQNALFRKDHVNFLLETTELGQHQEAYERPQPNVVRTEQIPPKQHKVEYESSSNANGFPSVIRNYAFALFVAVFAFAFVLYLTFGPQGWNSGKIRVNITALKTQFSSQEPVMWDTLKAGLMSSKSEGVQTFLFLHNSPRTAVCFIKKLSENNCIAYKAYDISNTESFVAEVKKKLLAHKCLVMFDLEDLHPDGVAVLKGFCDAYEPIVPDTQFFFALNAGPQLDTDAKKLARTLLETQWLKDFTHDDFGGTLTRLTQNVLKIRDEPNVPC